eukprot:TRINITY_DN6958_c0_g3_i1.p1 TRINITY_DN6958_c0_g3~~TRINITY_DN6958_c0_g3_i1.p1  ORF type:complete len:253 (+),score=45.54 TRINITY_DN6958_c0_g3_i1:39-797(+)
MYSYELAMRGLDLKETARSLREQDPSWWQTEVPSPSTRRGIKAALEVVRESTKLDAGWEVPANNEGKEVFGYRNDRELIIRSLDRQLGEQNELVQKQRQEIADLKREVNRSSTSNHSVGVNTNKHQIDHNTLSFSLSQSRLSLPKDDPKQPSGAFSLNSTAPASIPPEKVQQPTDFTPQGEDDEDSEKEEILLFESLRPSNIKTPRKLLAASLLIALRQNPESLSKVLLSFDRLTSKNGAVKKKHRGERNRK